MQYKEFLERMETESVEMIEDLYHFTLNMDGLSGQALILKNILNRSENINTTIGVVSSILRDLDFSGNYTDNIYHFGPWCFYESPSYQEIDKCGKWMYFFNGEEGLYNAIDLCNKAINDNVCTLVKHADNMETGVICFYNNADNIEGHKKIISFMIENNLIQRCRNGRYYNISFKLDEQTKGGQYGDDFKATLKLENFINLYTGDFIK